MQPEYLSSTSSLRSELLLELQSARPLQAASVAAMLRMYVELVQKDHFSISLAREAFEDSHVASLCELFGETALQEVGQLPAVNLSLAMNRSLVAIQEQREAVVREFHLGDLFLRRLEACLERKQGELEEVNQEGLPKCGLQGAQGEIGRVLRAFYSGDGAAGVAARGPACGGLWAVLHLEQVEH